MESSDANHVKFKGVSLGKPVCEVKNGRGNFYYTLPQGTPQGKAAVLVDLVMYRNDPDVDVKKLNLNTVVESLGGSLSIDKSFYQEVVEKNPLGSLTNKELWVKAQEVYNLLVRKVLGVEGRRREDEADIPPAFGEGSKYQEHFTFEFLQEVISSLEEASKKKDAECKKKDAECKKKDAECKKKDAKCKKKIAEIGRWKKACKKKDAESKEKDADIGRWKEAYEEKDAECKEKDAEIGRLKDELHEANKKVDGQPLKRRASSVAARGEIQRGNASPSKDATPALEDDIDETLFAEIDGLRDWHPIPPLPGEFTHTSDILSKPMNVDDVFPANYSVSSIKDNCFSVI